MHSSNLLWSCFLALRPKTLTAALVPCIAATALAKLVYGAFNLSILFWAILSAVCIQIATNLVNDAEDFRKGADTVERLGPKRITASGVLSFKQTYFLATIFFILDVAFGVQLVVHGGWVIVIIGLFSILMGYSYTGGPYPLAYWGLGDLFVILFFGIVATNGMFFLQTGSISTDSFILSLQIGFLATTLIAINNLRDINTDKKANKRTLAVLIGEKGSKIEITLLISVTFLLGAYWMVNGQQLAFYFSLITIPIAAILLKKLWSNDKNFNQMLAMSAGLHLLFGIFTSIAFLVS